MTYLKYEEVLIIHAKIIDETGGLHGVRDIHRIKSLIERPKMQFGGKDLYLFMFKKASVYFESCAHDHPFVDGNKRTDISIVARFLFLNGFELTATNAKLEGFVLNTVVKKYPLEKMADWFKKHSKKIK